jgi:L-ascorbate metabolism protein UlaG (beta-lactamase superfamily)
MWMKVTYLYHSGFAVELEKHIFVFDYMKGKLPDWDGRKEIIFFASHKHPDHFVMDIFQWFGKYENLRYVLGSDIKLSDKYLECNGVDPCVKTVITNAGKNRTLELGDVKIETLRSTDEGVAFIVCTEGKTIYHAGDLNWWHWEGEADSWNTQMEKDYKKEISLIDGRHFDVAFVPLDPRLEWAYGLGMQEFLEHTDTDHVFPMHMWDDYRIIDKYKKSDKGRQYADKVMEISRPGQEYAL